MVGLTQSGGTHGGTHSVWGYSWWDSLSLGVLMVGLTQSGDAHGGTHLF